jgi:hypothetical protein
MKRKSRVESTGAFVRGYQNLPALVLRGGCC